MSLACIGCVLLIRVAILGGFFLRFEMVQDVGLHRGTECDRGRGSLSLVFAVEGQCSCHRRFETRNAFSGSSNPRLRIRDHRFENNERVNRAAVQYSRDLRAHLN